MVKTSRLLASLRRQRGVRCISTVATLLSCTAALASAEDPDTILGFRTDGRSLVFRVATHGCTHKRDFIIDVVRPGASQVALTLRRLNPDECKGFFPRGEEISFTREEVGVPCDAEVLVRNPLQ